MRINYWSIFLILLAFLLGSAAIRWVNETVGGFSSFLPSKAHSPAYNNSLIIMLALFVWGVSRLARGSGNR